MFALDENSKIMELHTQENNTIWPYSVFRTSATDIYMLGFAINQVDYVSVRSDDRRMLNNPSFNNRQHYMFMNKIARYTPAEVMLVPLN